MNLIFLISASLNYSILFSDETFIANLFLLNSSKCLSKTSKFYPILAGPVGVHSRPRGLGNGDEFLITADLPLSVKAASI